MKRLSFLALPTNFLLLGCQKGKEDINPLLKRTYQHSNLFPLKARQEPAVWNKS
ncbi:hypothetical protein L1283_002648 [Sphingobacterium sp. HSC-15S19]